MRRALVAGALGVSGRAVVNQLAALEDWEVVGLSRRSPEAESSARYISVDLLNRSAADAVIRSLGDVTHIFYAALYWGSNIFDEVAPNLAMLQNLVEAVESHSPSFRQNCSSRGSKVLRSALRPLQDTSERGRPAARPAQLLLRPGRLFKGTFRRESMVVDSPASLHYLWVRRREPDEHGYSDCRLCGDLQGAQLATPLSRLVLCLRQDYGDDGCRSAGKSDGLGSTA